MDSTKQIPRQDWGYPTSFLVWSWCSRSQSKNRTPRVSPDAHARIGLKTLRAECKKDLHCHNEVMQVVGVGFFRPLLLSMEIHQKDCLHATQAERSKIKTRKTKTANRKSARKSVKSDTTVLSVDKQSKQTNSDSTDTVSLGQHGRVKCWVGWCRWSRVIRLSQTKKCCYFLAQSLEKEEAKQLNEFPSTTDTFAGKSPNQRN